MTFHMNRRTNRDASTPSFARFGIPFLFLTIASVYERGTPEQHWKAYWKTLKKPYVPTGNL